MNSNRFRNFWYKMDYTGLQSIARSQSLIMVEKIDNVFDNENR